MTLAWCLCIVVLRAYAKRLKRSARRFVGRILWCLENQHPHDLLDSTDLGWGKCACEECANIFDPQLERILIWSSYG